MIDLTALQNLVRVGPPVARNNLTVFPLTGTGAPVPVDYRPFGELATSGEVRITEVSESGSVSQLSVANESKHPTLLVDGEELLGAKQNRIVNLTILVPAQATLEIPVTCVEAGRWGYRTPGFTSSPNAMYPRARAKKSADISASLKSSGSRRSDQAGVWDEIAARQSELGGQSNTAAMNDIFTSSGSVLRQYTKGILPSKGDIGAVFAINGIVLGIELFEDPATYAFYFQRTLRSYSLEAVANAQVALPAVPCEEQVREFLGDIGSASVDRFPAIGLGEDLRIASPAVVGSALRVGHGMVHLAAFRKDITRDSTTRHRRGSRPHSSSLRAFITDPPQTIRSSAPRNTRTGVTAAAMPRPRRERYPLEIVNNHILIKLAGGLALIDTGSPISIGRGREFTWEQETFSPATTNVDILDLVSAHVGRQIEWLLGYDVLRRSRLLLDWKRGRAEVAPAIAPTAITTRIPMEPVMGVPVLVAGHAGRPVRAVIDSGAAICYAPSAALVGAQSTGRHTDFYPGFGEFETNTYVMELSVGGREFTATVGVLPPMLQTLFGMLLGNEGWIIGVDFFRDRSIVLDYGRRQLLDVVAAPRVQ